MARPRKTNAARKAPEVKVHDRQATNIAINSVVSVTIVDDPYSDIGEKIHVLRSIRDDPLAGMHSRGQIDDAMLAAGRKWQLYHEHAEIGSISAINPMKEAVDGGRIPEPITDRQIKAMRELNEADKKLGLEGCALIRDILGNRQSLAVAAHARGMSSAREINYLGRRLRECLDTLAVHFGFATKKAT